MEGTGEINRFLPQEIVSKPSVSDNSETGIIIVTRSGSISLYKSIGSPNSQSDTVDLEAMLAVLYLTYL